MSERPSAGIGRRLAKYRRLNGLSAQQLSDKLEGELSRGVIANIESGRKVDVTVDQLIALAWALDIPPVALALPIDQPFKFVNIVATHRARQSSRAWALTEWFSKGSGEKSAGKHESGENVANAIARTTLVAIGQYMQLRLQFNGMTSMVDGHIESDSDEAELTELESRMRELAEQLEALGVDLNEYKIDE